MAQLGTSNDDDAAAVAAVLDVTHERAAQLLADRSVVGRANLARLLDDALAPAHPKTVKRGSPEWFAWCEHADRADSISVRARLVAVASPPANEADCDATRGMLEAELRRIEADIERGTKISATVHREELIDTVEGLLALVEHLRGGAGNAGVHRQAA